MYFQTAVVAEFTVKDGFIQVPAGKNADQNTTYGKEDIGTKVVTCIENAHTENLCVTERTKR